MKSSSLFVSLCCGLVLSSGLTRPASAQAAPPPGESEVGETIVLSPFEVTTDNKGYYAPDTTAGTRIGSKIEDLGASISVITKQQMEDFALLTADDVFTYELSTEGTGNYTDLSYDGNGNVSDNTQLNPTSANRIRGVGRANTSLANFQTSGLIPVDPLEIESIEISRGPNSSLFGLGGGGGNVNAIPATANIRKDRSQLAFRVDSDGGYRSSLNLNRVLVPGKLAIRGTALRQHEGFVRKPSGTDTDRYNAMVKFQPFSGTTITGAYTYYHSYGKRPNTSTPGDAITRWLNQGAPTWNPLTSQAKINGVVTGGLTATGGPLVLNATANGARAMQVYVTPDGIEYVDIARGTSTANPTTVASVTRQYAFLAARPSQMTNLVLQPLFGQGIPAVSDKSIYDWTEINLTAPYSEDTRGSYAAGRLEHVFINKPDHQLAVELAVFREVNRRNTTPMVGEPTGSGNGMVLGVDVNEFLLNGEPNPYFLRPFIIAGQNILLRHLENDRKTYRAQMAYRLDLTGRRGLLRWLGAHNLTGYTEYRDFENRSWMRWAALTSEHSWAPLGRSRIGTSAQGGLPGSATGIEDVRVRYYLGDNTGFNVDYAPGSYAPGQYQLGYGLTPNYVYTPITLGEVAAANTWGGSRTVQKVHGAILQSHLLRGRVITTLGYRYDEQYTKLPKVARLHADGLEFDDDIFVGWREGDWNLGKGPTKTAGIVVRPLSWVSVYANKSDSFQPSGPAQDIYLRALPNPTSEGVDYGFGMNLLKGKVYLRVNRYETESINSRGSSVAAQRLARVDYWDISSGGAQNPWNLYDKAREWVVAGASSQGQTLSNDEIASRISDIMKLPAAYMTRLEPVLGAAEDLVAKGTEVELHYNPTAFWTLKLNAARQRVTNTRIADEVYQYYLERLEVWKSIIDPLTGLNWYTSIYEGTSSSASSYIASQVEPVFMTSRMLLGKSQPRIREYRLNLSTNYRLAGLTDHKVLKKINVGGALRWESPAIIGYYGVEQLPETVTMLDINRPYKDDANLNIDFVLGYRTRIFRNKVDALVQLNVRNLQEDGRLTPTAIWPDGTVTGYRIVDPRRFTLSVTLDL